ncbi:autotransporter outer membrane beta-barrel domain-containing protein [Fusobacterium sp. THCT13E1]
MIERIIKAVKRGNKKRSINITIGAVVGFLLSCTAVMGADEYLWIKNDGGGIKFNTAKTTEFDGTDGTWNEANPYSKNSWDGNSTYINNMTLYSDAINGKRNSGHNVSYGLRLSGDLSRLNFINNSLITATENTTGCGILNSGKIGNIANDGLIIGNGEGNGGFGIYNEGSSTITSVINNGLIAGIDGAGGNEIMNAGNIETIENNGFMTSVGDNSSQGISNTGEIGTLLNNGFSITIAGADLANKISNKGEIETIINNGFITAIGEYYGRGIYNDSTKNIGNITNNGLIIGIVKEEIYGRGYGILNSGSIETITNTGIIYGQTNAVNNETGKTIASLDNYGILATKGSSAINNDGTITTENNYGLYITDGDGKVSFDVNKQSNSPVEIVVGHDDSGNEMKREMVIKNAELEGVSGSATETKSITFSGTENYNKHILNGKDSTLKVSGIGNEITGSIINAYGTAVVFDTAGGEIALSGTIVNGGIDGKSTVLGSDNADKLTLQSGKIIYKNGITETQNTIINGNIDMGAGDDILSVGNGTIINGILVGGTGDDTLNLGATTSNTRALSNGGISIRQNVSDFENININGNVTVFETTVGNDGKTTDLKISRVDTVTIGETGVLNLRLKDTGTTTDVGGNLIPNAGHAFLGNNMIIQGEGNGADIAGTLNFVTNGIGREIYVDMTNIELKNLYIKTSSVIDGYDINENVSIVLGAYGNLDEIYRPENTRGSSLTEERYESLNNIYKGIYSSTGDNLDALRTLISFNNFGNNYEENMSDEEQLKNLMSYLSSIYTGSPYSYSSELSRRSAGMFRDIVTENEFKPELNKWMIMGGLTHADGGTKDTYYGRNYHGFDGGTSDTESDMKLTGAYMLAKYGYSENLSLGLTLGGNKSEAEMSISKVKGNSGYIGVFAENYRGNLTLKAGAGIQYSEYDANRRTIGGYSYNKKYSDMAYDIYLNGRYSHNIGDNLFLEPYATLSYTYIDQDGANEGSKTLAIETDSKSFDYTVGKVGIDLKKVILHEKGKSTVSAGVSYTRILDGADEEFITGRFKGGTDFDILVAHKNEHSIGLNAKYALELENGVLFDVKGTYAVERDSHNNSGKNKTKGEWIVGVGLGYKF